jgi:hypothetical protein
MTLDTGKMDATQARKAEVQARKEEKERDAKEKIENEKKKLEREKVSANGQGSRSVFNRPLRFR